jgi:two-component system sensor histidine kinase CpxA
MPRLFWKLFLALWLSIMAFAAVVSWINQSLILQYTLEESGRGIVDKQQRLMDRLVREMVEQGQGRAKRSMRELPRGIRDHIFILDADGNELLGREQVLNRLRQERHRVSRKQFEAADGQVYTMVSSGRRPPRALLEPGPRGVGMRLLVAALVSALVSLILARYLAAPLGQLSHAGLKLASGDLSARVGTPLIKRNDEFGQLARDMDKMAARLQSSHQANQRLLRDVSHELRSPLARLRVALEIARNKDQNQVSVELDRIELESERLEKLVDEVLSLLRESSAPDELKKQGFDLAELLQELVETANYESGEVDQQGSRQGDQRIVLLVEPPLMLNADRDLIWRVIENLLRNALIHGGKNGAIQVDALLSAKQEIVISVKDSGPGIAEAQLNNIFEPFYRLDEARTRSSAGGSTGHGLGLAIAATAVRRHGGRITAVNRKSGGLEVQVLLPV